MCIVERLADGCRAYMILLLRFIMFCLAVFIADDSLCKSSEPLEDVQDSVKCVDMLSRLCAADKKLVFIINVFWCNKDVTNV